MPRSPDDRERIREEARNLLHGEITNMQPVTDRPAAPTTPARDAPARIPLVIASVPKPITEMTDAEGATWSDNVAAGMADQYERLTGVKVPRPEKPRRA
jgi:hypothetical protein